MRKTPAQQTRIHAVLRALQQDRKLVGIVRELAQEIERLREDNAQLQASVQIYREVANRRTATEGEPSFIH